MKEKGNNYIYLIWIVSIILGTNTEHVPTEIVITVFAISITIAWAGYKIYSKLSKRKKRKKEDRERSTPRGRVLKSGNKRLFIKERIRLVNAWDSMVNREEYFLSKDRDDKVKEIYLQARNQMERYLLDAGQYLESFDYISGKESSYYYYSDFYFKDSSYLENLCTEAETMLDKFNKMVELSVSIDDDVMSYDTREIDDMIEVLEELKNAGKNKLTR